MQASVTGSSRTLLKSAEQTVQSVNKSLKEVAVRTQLVIALPTYMDEEKHTNKHTHRYANRHQLGVRQAQHRRKIRQLLSIKLFDFFFPSVLCFTLLESHGGAVRRRHTNFPKNASHRWVFERSHGNKPNFSYHCPVIYLYIYNPKER